MAWDTIAGNWNEFKYLIKKEWAKLSDDDLKVIGGKKEELCGRLQKQYGYDKDEAERKIDFFAGNLRITCW